jgi:hypothetical protein
VPTIFRQDGFRFFFYSNEGDPREPPHVHVTRDGAEAKFWLGPPVELGRSGGYDAKTLRRLARMVEDHRKVVVEAWHEHFG